ncbi:MAG: nitrogen fixation protein NifZ [Proteobacteria bacterium]|nr:nitrogen fixation protein NifZ [Pseudomonadota bacterium]
MDEIRPPKFQWGQPVLAAIDLVNDGTYPDCVADELLTARGSQGEVVQVGNHVETQTPIYLVEFPNGRVIGCLEEEISAA